MSINDFRNKINNLVTLGRYQEIGGELRNFIAEQDKNFGLDTMEKQRFIEGGRLSSERIFDVLSNIHKESEKSYNYFV